MLNYKKGELSQLPVSISLRIVSSENCNSGAYASEDYGSVQFPRVAEGYSAPKIILK